MTAIIISLVAIIGVFVLTYLIYRLNIYISSLENKVAKQNILIENLTNSVKEVVAEGFLQNDGRLKKFQIQREDRGSVYNGIEVKESYSEI